MSKPRSGPRKRDITRARVMQAAADCIYREGFRGPHQKVPAERSLAEALQ